MNDGTPRETQTIAQLRRSLAISRKRLYTLLDAFDGAVFTDNEGRIVDVSDGVLHTSGFTRAEVIGRRPPEVFRWGHEQSQNVTEEVLSSMAENGRWIGRINIKNHDGQDIWLDQIVVPWVDEAGNRVGTLGLHLDAADRWGGTRKKLRDMEERVDAAFALRPISFWEWDFADGTILYDDRLPPILGTEREDMGSNIYWWEKLVHPEDRAKTQRLLTKHLKGELGRFHARYRVCHVDQSWVWIEHKGKVLSRTADGRARRMVGTIEDVSEQVRQQRALETSERRFLEVFRKSTDAVLLLSNSRIADCNDAAVRFFGGKSRSDLLNRHPAELSPPLQPDGVPSLRKAEDKIAEALERGSARFEWYHEKASGEAFWTSVSLILLPYEGTERIYAALRNISKLKHAEEALRRSKESLRVLLDATSDFTMLVDSELRILAANREAQRSLGGTEEELLGQVATTLLPPELARARAKLLLGALDSGVAVKFEDGREGRVFENNVYPIFDSSGEAVGLAVYGRDITERNETRDALREAHDKLEERVTQRTQELVEANQRLELEIAERKKAEEERALYQEQLFHAQKLEAVGSLAGGIAHDFNNLLTAIRGSVELILSRMVPGEPMMRYADEALKATDRAETLTRQLLAFSRRQVVQKRLLDFNELLEGMIPLLRRILPEGIALVPDLRLPGALVLGDAGQLEQVVMNLVVNARDAIGEKGTIRLTVKDCMPDGCTDHPDFTEPTGPGFCFQVVDDGSGMETEALERAFEPFFTTKGMHQGTGLGLAVVYGIVQQHDGQCGIWSMQGTGTRVSVYLPRAEGVIERDEVGSTAFEPREPQRGLTVLVVEDESGVLDFATSVLEDFGFKVLSAASGFEARELFANHSAEVDVLFSDVCLPDDDGLEIALDLRKERPTLPVLLASGYVNLAGNARRIVDLGIPFLQKPYGLTQLLDALHRAITRDEP